MALDREQTERLEALYREMYDALYRYANRMLRNPSLAEEAVQEAFLIAATKAQELFDSGNPQGWMHKTVYNVVQNMRRSLARGKELVLRLMAQAGETRPEDGAADFADLMQDSDFLLVRRVTLEGYSMREAAQELGISLEACKKRLQRAKQRLRERLK